MKNLDMMYRMRRMNQLIAMRATGTPKEFAEKVDLSVSRLYDILIEMKELGAPVKYCRIERTYKYEDKGELKIDIDCKYIKN